MKKIDLPKKVNSTQRSTSSQQFSLHIFFSFLSLILSCKAKNFFDSIFFAIPTLAGLMADVIK